MGSEVDDGRWGTGRAGGRSDPDAVGRGAGQEDVREGAPQGRQPG